MPLNPRKSSTSLDDGLALEDRRPKENVHFRHRSTLRYSDSISYPKAVIFIIGNEFCERFTYYGLNTILALYLKNHLRFSDTTATVVFHVFVMFCYFFPLLGGIIADSWLGKFRTILYLSIVYMLGGAVLSISAVPGVPDVAFTLAGLILIATGAGCIKPCVSAFGGDQFILPEQESHLKKFFSLLYFTINAGSFIGSTVTPILRQTDCMGERNCYTLAFAVPTATVALSIVIFFSGTKFYKRKRPDGNAVLKFIRCVLHALRKRERVPGRHWLDKAADKYDPVFISDVKAVLRVLALFVPLPFFWALFDQQGSRWTFQASRMNGDVGVLRIHPDQMQVINPILILVFIPLFEAFVYPGFAKYNFLKKPLQRLTVGGLLAALAFVVSALVEFKLEETYAILPKPGEGQIRLYNALPEQLSIRFLDPPYEPINIASLGFWREYHVPAKKEAIVKFEYTAQGTEKTANLSVFENSLTSYIIMADRVVQIPNDDTDKSIEGYPKIMVIYATPTKEISVLVQGCKDTHEYTVSKAQPYTEYGEYEECERYRVEVNGKEIIKDGHMKPGGVYVVMILEGDGGALTTNPLTVIHPNTLHMLWLVPQYVIITAAEVMFSITGLEFSFTQAPVSMKAILQASWLLTIAFGNLIVAIVAQAKIFERLLFEFLLFAGLMTLDMIAFAVMAMRYKYVTVVDPREEEQTTPKKY